MAKATAHLTCSQCGASFALSSTRCNRRDADNWKAWQESRIDQGLCPSCYRAAAEAQKQETIEKERAAADALEESDDSLADLEGSAKQIAWARSIRAKAINACDLAVSGNAGPEYPAFREWLAGQTSASWWIEHRDFTGDDVSFVLYQFSVLWSRETGAKY